MPRRTTPNPTVYVGNATADEGGNLRHTVTLSSVQTTPAIFAFSLVGNTATGTSDFSVTPTFSNGVTLLDGRLTVPAGVTRFSVRYPTVDDARDEANETTTLTVGAATGVGNITDDDPAPRLSVNDIAVYERAGVAVFTVTLSVASGRAVTVGYNTSSSTATTGNDFSSVLGSLTFAPGVTAQTVTVPIVNDAAIESTETFRVNLTGAQNATISDEQGVGAVLDDDRAPTIESVGDASAIEGGNLVHTVRLSNASDRVAMYDFSLKGDSASTSDFGATPSFSNGVTLRNGQITVPVGVSSFTVTVPTIDDRLVESSEKTKLTIGSKYGRGTITDNDLPAAAFSVNDVSVTEGGVMTFTVTRSGDTRTTQSVNFATGLTGATAETADFASRSGTLSFGVGVTSKTFTVQTTQDAVYEGNETFRVTLSNATNGATINDATGVGTIVDNEHAPTISRISDATSTEGAALVHTVTLSNASATPTTFAFSLRGSSAESTDFSATPTFSSGVTLRAGQITVPAGVTSFTVSVPTVDDQLVESTETTRLSVGSVTATGTIRDNDVAPAAFSVNDVSVTEGGAMTFTVTRSGDARTAQSVNFSTGLAGTAEANDFTSRSGTLSFGVGVTSKTFTVQTTQDAVYEGDETFRVTLSNATNGATIADATGVGTIVDNERATTVSDVSNAAATEGAALVHTVTLSNPSEQVTTFRFVLGGITASSDDFSATPSFSHGVTLNGGQLTVPAGVSSFTVSVPTVDDVRLEFDEWTGLAVGSEVGVGTIRDDELRSLFEWAVGADKGDELGAEPGSTANPTLAVNDVSVNEGAGNAVFTVTLSAASSQTVTVSYTTANATALAGDDYTAATGTLTFAPGATTRTVTVAVANDLVDESNETFNVTLTAPTNATIADGSGVGTIVDNDNAPTLSVSNASATEGASLVHSVTLSNPSAVATTYAFSLIGGSAASGGDFTASPSLTNAVTINAGVVTVPAGVTSFMVSYPTLQDALDEGSETTVMTLGGVSAQGSIADDDTPPTVTVNDVTVNEAAGVAVFTVSLSALSGQTVTVGYNTSGASAQSTDFGSVAGTLTFAPGISAQSVTVAITNDRIDESNETFNVTLTTATNATIAGNQGVGTIVDNDEAPTLSVGSATATEGAVLTHAVTLSNPSAVATTYAFSLAAGSAVAGSDFTAMPSFSNSVTLNAGMLTVPAGVTAFTVSYATLQDTLDEVAETTSLTIGGVVAQGVVTDDDAPPALSVGNVSVGEAAGTAVFTVSLSAASGEAVTVGYNTSNGTAQAGPDYTATTGTLSFAPGVTSQSVTVSVASDLIDEANESFNVNLTSPTNAALAVAQGVGTIGDDDSAPTLAVSSASATEGENLIHNVTLSNPSAVVTIYAYSLIGGTAVSGSDFAASPSFSNGVTMAGGFVTVPAGVTSFTVSYPTLQDALDEASESSTLTLGGIAVQGTIVDDDAPPSVSVSNVSVNEAAGVAVFTVSLSAASGQAVAVDFNTGNVTAIAGLDYTSTTGSATFAPGSTLQSVTINVADDLISETDETFTVNLLAASNATIANAQGVGTVLDNDSVPTVAVGDATAAEGADLVHTVTLSNASALPMTYSFSLSGASAAAGDFAAAPVFSANVTISDGMITVPAGVTSFTVSYPTLQDALDESAETTLLSINGVSAQGIITDDDATPTLSVSDVTVSEGGVAVFSVSLSEASGQWVTVAYATGNREAQAGSDYTVADGTLTFAPGTTVQLVTVTIADDLVDETTETFSVNLSAATNARMASTSGVGVIVDNDNAPTLSVGAASATEGGNLAHIVTLSNPSAAATTYALSLVGGSALAGVDFVSAPVFSTGVTFSEGLVTVPAGMTSFTVSYPALQDTLNELNETTTLTLAGVSGQGIIRDDDAPPVLTVSNATVSEAAGAAVFTVSLSTASGQTVTANYDTVGGVAQAGLDYTAAGGSLTFAPGVTAQTVTVDIANDAVDEQDEAFNLTLSAVSNATIGGAAGVGLIIDNDNAPTLTISMASATEGSGLVHTVSLSNPSSVDTSYAFGLVGGSATAGSDFAAALIFSNGVTTGEGRVTVPAGVSSFTVSYPTLQDALDESDETISLVIAGATATGTILDDDASPTVSVGNVAVNEAAGSAEFPVNLSAPSGQLVTVGYATSDGTAQAGLDYTSASGSLTFAPGVTSQLATIAIANDLVHESDETFNLTLSASTNSVLASAVSTGTILDNDSVPTVSVSNASANEGGTLIHTVSMSNPSSMISTYAFNLTAVSAVGGGDFITTPSFDSGVTLVAGIITVPAGVTSFTVSIPTIDDAQNEPTETIALTIGGSTGTGSILDNDSVPSLAVGNVEVNEAAGAAVFTVTLSAVSGQTVTAEYNTSDNSASAGSDFSASFGTLTFAPGQTVQTLTVAVADDLIDEANEFFSFGLSTPTNATIAANPGVCTVIDNDDLPTLSLSEATAIEGRALVHTVTLSNPSSTALVYALGLAEGSSAAGIDFIADPIFSDGVILGSGLLTVPAGVSSFTVSYPTLQDALDEPDETTSLTLAGQAAIGTILDDEVPPTVSARNVTVNEADGVAVFAVSLSAPSGWAVTVAYSTGDDGALAGSDYTENVGALTFAPGVTTQLVTVAVADDLVVESAEGFSFNLLAATNATLGDSSAQCLIVDNDLPAATVISVSSPWATEGSPLVFSVQLSGSRSVATTYMTAVSGTAIVNEDVLSIDQATFSDGVTSSAGALTVPAGVSSFTVNYATLSDLMTEPVETFALTVADKTGTGYLYDIDAGAPPAVSINDVAVYENAGMAIFTVTLSSASTQPVSVSYETSDITAGRGGDYSLTTGALTFAPGETSKTISVPIVDDFIVEGNESFVVNLSVPVNATLAKVQASGTIIEDDIAPPPTVISVSSPWAIEGSPLAFSVQLSGSRSVATTYTTAVSGTAIVNDVRSLDQATFSDGVTSSVGVLTVPADVSSFTVNYATLSDLMTEPVETLALTVADKTGTGYLYDIDAGAPPAVSINDVAVYENAGMAIFTVTLSSASTQQVSVSYETSDITAGRGGDYSLTTGALTLAPGETSKTISVPIVDDFIVEGNESFVVNLSVPVNATLAKVQASGTIIEDDIAPPPTVISVSSPWAIEGSPLAFSVQLSGSRSVATTYTTAVSGTTVADEDVLSLDQATFSDGVTSSAGVLTVPAGVSGFTVNYTTLSDLMAEPVETLALTVADKTGTGYLYDIDAGAPPAVSINDVAVYENAGMAIFTVTLSSASTQPVSVSYQTSDITAGWGGDYSPNFGTLNFAPGETCKTISVAIIDDALVGGDLAFVVNLVSATNATIADAQGVGAILDDDGGLRPSAPPSPPTPVITPLVLDLNNDGVHSVGIGAGVFFDVNAEGVARNVGWVSAQDGLLVRDINGNGEIDNGSELFGSGTSDGLGGKTADGFSALALVDGNKDGVINSLDLGFNELQVWRDLNINGVTEAGELLSLESLGVQSLGLANTTSAITENGNLHLLLGDYTTTDGQTHELTDVFFGAGERLAKEAVPLHGQAAAATGLTSDAEASVWHVGAADGNVLVKGFDVRHDVLDLRDLLPGNQCNEVDSLLSIKKEGCSTVIGVKDVAGVDHSIILAGVDLLGGGSDQQIIHDLLNSQKIITD